MFCEPRDVHTAHSAVCTCTVYMSMSMDHVHVHTSTVHCDYTHVVTGSEKTTTLQRISHEVMTCMSPIDSVTVR